MSCTVSDILVIEKARAGVSVMTVGSDGLLSDLQRAKLEEISNILDSINYISIDDELDAIKVALEDIRDRDD